MFDAKGIWDDDAQRGLQGLPRKEELLQSIATWAREEQNPKDLEEASEFRSPQIRGVLLMIQGEGGSMMDKEQAMFRDILLDRGSVLDEGALDHVLDGFGYNLALDGDGGLVWVEDYGDADEIFVK